MYILDSGCGWIPDAPVKFMYHIINLLKNLTPAILIIMGSLDFGKAIMSQKEDEIKKAQGSFIKKLIAGAAVFFVVVLARWIVDIVNNSLKKAGENPTNAFNCVSLLLTGKYSADDKSYYDPPVQKPTQTTKDYNYNQFQTCEECQQYYKKEISECAGNENDNIYVKYWDDCNSHYESRGFSIGNTPDPNYFIDAAALYAECVNNAIDEAGDNYKIEEIIAACETEHNNYAAIIKKYNLGSGTLNIPTDIYNNVDDSKFGFLEGITSEQYSNKCTSYAQAAQKEYNEGQFKERYESCSKMICDQVCK
ncbi:MAG: hypothetical protein HFI86_05390 [Bacilli bacterium]|nr:hypothetical protein [Bacilli bacterium]